MKKFLLIALTFIGTAILAPEAQAGDCRNYDRGHSSYRRSHSSYGYSYRRSDCQPRAYYGRSYHYSAPRYYRAERCYTERRHSFRPPLISFLFGF